MLYLFTIILLFVILWNLYNFFSTLDNSYTKTLSKYFLALLIVMITIIILVCIISFIKIFSFLIGLLYLFTIILSFVILWTLYKFFSTIDNPYAKTLIKCYLALLFIIITIIILLVIGKI